MPKSKSNLSIMYALLKLVAPFTPLMCFTIVMGTLGYLSATGITVLGAVGVLNLLGYSLPSPLNSLHTICIVTLSLALLRGILRYLEQATGHYIAFKLLAFIRDKVFKALRNLAPSKLDTKDSGQLISLITGDVELLEVFYAHTIAPIVIALLTCSVTLALFYYYSPLLACIALMSYITIGYLIPSYTTKRAKDIGKVYRQKVGNLNQFFLESLYGMKEIILFNNQEARKASIHAQSEAANQSTQKIKMHEGKTNALTETSLLGFSILMLLTGTLLYYFSKLSFAGLLICFVLLMSSYGPVVALSRLSNNLLQTLASGERVLNLLEETPSVKDITKGTDISYPSITLQNVSFGYNKTPILKNLSLTFNPGDITCIIGQSGCGKSTLLKLIMRFYVCDKGHILIGGNDINTITTSNLRKNIAYVTQDTYLFNTTLEENLRIAKRDATKNELISACQKAHLYEFIESLPEGFNTQVGELGTCLSSGERQRLGIARAFLQNSPIILLDEPTSNLDSLNESIILNALKACSKEKLIIIVSHRLSTMSIANRIYKFDAGRS